MVDRGVAFTRDDQGRISAIEGEGIAEGLALLGVDAMERAAIVLETVASEARATNDATRTMLALSRAVLVLNVIAVLVAVVTVAVAVAG